MNIYKTLRRTLHYAQGPAHRLDRCNCVTNLARYNKIDQFQMRYSVKYVSIANQKLTMYVILP